MKLRAFSAIGLVGLIASSVYYPTSLNYTFQKAAESVEQSQESIEDNLVQWEEEKLLPENLEFFEKVYPKLEIKNPVYLPALDSSAENYVDGHKAEAIIKKLPGYKNMVSNSKSFDAQAPLLYTMVNESNALRGVNDICQAIDDNQGEVLTQEELPENKYFTPNNVDLILDYCNVETNDTKEWVNLAKVNIIDIEKRRAEVEEAFKKYSYSLSG